MRLTQQRKCILAELQRTTCHPTASELYQKVRRKMPHLSLGTVYRNLQVLVRHGHIRKLESGNSESRYDGDLTDHYHFRCVQCGCIRDIFLEGISTLASGLSSQGDFIVEGLNIDIYGICSDCRKNKSVKGEGASGNRHKQGMIKDIRDTSDQTAGGGW